jgi:hypothetical protein
MYRVTAIAAIILTASSSYVFFYLSKSTTDIEIEKVDTSKMTEADVKVVEAAKEKMKAATP